MKISHSEGRNDHRLLVLQLFGEFYIDIIFLYRLFLGDNIDIDILRIRCVSLVGARNYLQLRGNSRETRLLPSPRLSNHSAGQQLTVTTFGLKTVNITKPLRRFLMSVAKLAEYLGRQGGETSHSSRKYPVASNSENCGTCYRVSKDTVMSRAKYII